MGDFKPRDGKAHKNEWKRNKFTFTGTHYYVTRAFYKEAGSEQCELALNDWCVQNSPYKYARFDVGQNQQDFKQWRCYSSGALTEDTFMTDLAAMELYPENRCPSIAQGAIAGVPEPTDATCFGHWTRDSELKSVLGSPVCGPAFYNEAGSKQCEFALNDWCVQNTPYKYARFDVGWNHPDTKSWRCYSSGALTEDTYSADMAAMSVSENKCPEEGTAGIPEPNEATCWNHWTRDSELQNILDSPVCGQDFYVQLSVGVTESPLGYGYVTTNEECQAARAELQITRWNDEENKSASDRGAYCWIRQGWKANFNPAGDFGTDFSESSLICKLELPSNTNTRRLLKLNA